MRVKDLLYNHGFTIAGARKRLRDGGVEPVGEGEARRQAAEKMRRALLDLRKDVVAMLGELGHAPAAEPPSATEH